jgi:hypothetical protein
VRKTVFFVAVGLLGLRACLFAQRFYVVREALVCFGFTALLAFSGFNLLLLGVLLKEVHERMLRIIRKSVRKMPAPRQVSAEHQIVLYKGAPTIGGIQKIGLT